MANIWIEGMRRGDGKILLDALPHQGSIYRMNAIAFSCICKADNAQIAEKIRKLKGDNAILDGYSVSDFAKAALDIMQIEKYSGDNVRIRNLIESGFVFLR